MRTIISLLLAFIPLVVLAASPAMRSPSPPTLQTSVNSTRLYDMATRQAQYGALRAMPKVDIQYAEFGRVELIEGSTAMVASVARLQRGDHADVLMRQLAPILMATPADRLRVKSVEDRRVRSEGFELGGHDVFLEQTINGLPVIDASVNLRTNEAGEVVVVSSRFVPAAGVSRTPALSIGAVKEKVSRDLVAGGIATKGSVKLNMEGQLGYWTDEGKLDRPILVWILSVSYRSLDGEIQAATVSADATTGEVRSLLHDSFGMRRIVHTLNGEANYTKPWTLLWDEFPPNHGNQHAVTMYNNVVKPRDFWASVGWNYETVNLVANWGVANNALYVTSGGIHSIISGNDLALDLDTVSHEYGHGVFLDRAPSRPAAWSAEWYAINEFYADVSAVFTDMAQRGGQYSDPHTWQIASLNGSPLRDLSFPKNPLVHQAAYQDYRDWYPKRSWCCNQSGVAHRNMTIFGHALYLLRHGGVHSRAGLPWSSYPFSFPGDTIPTIPITAISDTQLLKYIFVQGLANMRIYNAPVDGPHLKVYTSSVASSLDGPTLEANVSNAWRAVGIHHDCAVPPPPPAYVLLPEYCKGRYGMEWTQQPGVTYVAQVVPLQLPWDVYGQTVTDGEVSSCSVNLPATRKFRMRACNGCGCSAWTYDEYLHYYSPCL